MSGALHSHGPGEHHPVSMQSTLLAAGTLILTLLAVVILFLGVYVTPAT